jgi:hypothetical protein
MNTKCMENPKRIMSINSERHKVVEVKSFYTRNLDFLNRYPSIILIQL